MKRVIALSALLAFVFGAVDTVRLAKHVIDLTVEWPYGFTVVFLIFMAIAIALERHNSRPMA